MTYKILHLEILCFRSHFVMHVPLAPLTVNVLDLTEDTVARLWLDGMGWNLYFHCVVRCIALLLSLFAGRDPPPVQSPPPWRLLGRWGAIVDADNL